MKSKNKTSALKKDFIDYLASMTPEEINDYIKSKGKKAKPISPFIVDSNFKWMNQSK